MFDLSFLINLKVNSLFRRWESYSVLYTREGRATVYLDTREKGKGRFEQIEDESSL